MVYSSVGDDMTRSGFIEKAHVIASLRSRELHSRADWVDRALPDLIDTSKNASLLQTLGIDVPASTLQSGPATASAPTTAARDRYVDG